MSLLRNVRHIYPYAHTDAHTHTHTLHTYAHTYIPMRPHAQACARMRTYAHTQLHMGTPLHSLMGVQFLILADTRESCIFLFLLKAAMSLL